MPEINGSIVGKRPIIQAVFHVSRPRLSALVKAGLENPDPFVGPALIDTGATASCVDPLVTQALRLEPREITLAHTASSGRKPYRGTAVDMAIILLPARDREFHFTAGNPLFLPAISAFQSDLYHRQKIYALIGQDVLERCLLTHNGPESRFSLSWV